ncbi:hypothetical protein ACIQTN_01965 [Streptomyces werraensis]|uniref:hypothetical protein n=1 Tax=Streptomyces werraensis TaxID=68284 RepID=UPI003817CBE7
MYVRIEYPNDKAIEAKGETLEELVDALNVAIVTLWGKRNAHQNALTIEEMEEWLNQTRS